MFELKSLKEFNEEKKAEYFRELAGYNGITCPNCGFELVDTNPGCKLMGTPPQAKIHCQTCDFSSYRIY